VKRVLLTGAGGFVGHHTNLKLEQREPLNSVGLVCTCGKALATIEGAARTCECGRTWLVTAMLLGEAAHAAR
jgi:thioester reductase-like protein